MEIDQADVKILRERCDAAISQKRFAEAAEWARCWADAEPDNRRVRQHLAHLLLLAGDWIAARSACEHILALDPEHPDVRGYIAHIDAAERQRAAWTAFHYQQVEALTALAPDVLFIGDSLTLGWQQGGRPAWNRYFEPLGAGNIGIAGDTTRDVLWRIENGALDTIGPRLIVLMIGTNDLPSTEPPMIAERVGQVVGAIRQRQPAATLLLLGLLPRDARPDTVLRQKLSQVNGALAELADGRTVVFLDCGAALLQADGTLPAEISPDALHLSEQGYACLAPPLHASIIRILERT
jgi:lysophospholipase L1-like esterase